MKARRLLALLLRQGWVELRRRGSHRLLAKAGYAPIVFAHHEGAEVPPHLVEKIAKAAGLAQEDL